MDVYLRRQRKLLNMYGFTLEKHVYGEETPYAWRALNAPSPLRMTGFGAFYDYTAEVRLFGVLPAAINNLFPGYGDEDHDLHYTNVDHLVGELNMLRRSMRIPYVLNRAEFTKALAYYAEFNCIASKGLRFQRSFADCVRFSKAPVGMQPILKKYWLRDGIGTEHLFALAKLGDKANPLLKDLFGF